MKEVEAKAKLKDFEGIKSKLAGLGCTFSEPVIQKDRIYLQKGVEFPDKKEGTLFARIRDSDGRFKFTLKKQLATEHENIEKEVTIDDPEAFNEILKLMGYHEVLKVSKKRIKCKHGDLNICLDEVERLDGFIEVEKITEEDDTTKAREELTVFLESLGIKREDHESKGYATQIYELDNT